MLVSAEGIVLQRWKEGDENAVLLILTSVDLVKLRVHGILKSKNRSRLLIEPGSIIQINYYSKQESISSAKNIDLVDRLENIKSDYKGLQVLTYFLDLTIRCTPGSELSQLYLLLKGTILTLNELRKNIAIDELISEIRLLLIFFKIRLLKILGLLGDSTICNQCGTTLNRKNARVTDNLNFLCSKCHKKSQAYTEIAYMFFFAANFRFSKFLNEMRDSSLKHLNKSNSLIDNSLDNYLNERPREYENIYEILHLT